jgi:predicted ATP-dependent protease
MRAYSYKKNENKTVKVLVLLFLIFAITSVVVIYSFNQQLAQSNLQIKNLKFDVANLQRDLQDKLEIINNKTKIIEGLQTKLQIDELLIEDLGNKLGMAQGQVKALTPVIKKYYAVGVRYDVGVIIPFEIKLTNGTGLVSVNIRNVELLTGTQESIRIAVAVAEMQTNTDLSDKDVTVIFTNEEQEIVSLDGPSAGAVITTTIIAAIENRTLDTSILATGSINPDGSIGYVGGISEKAAAAASFGAKTFVIPYGQKISSESIKIIEAKNIQELTNLVLK